MRRILLFAIAAILVISLYACSIFGSTSTPQNASILNLPALSLAVQPQAGTYNTVGQTISYSYVVTNNGTQALTGSVTILDDKVGVNCPNLNTIGNKDNNLDGQESLTCSSNYAIAQADLNVGSITSHATATVGGVDSNKVTTVVQITMNKVLALTITASPTTFSQPGQTINFTYSIKNTGTTTLGPAQFVVSIDRLGAINCLSSTAVLAANESMTCTSAYTTTANDTVVSQLTFSGIATGAGAGVVQPASFNLTNTNVVSNPGTTSSTLTRGSTVPHTVEDGEWMIQIARCYGADFNAVRNANPQVIDPDHIASGIVLTIPNIGSNGNIYGPKHCITYHTAQASDTWDSIAKLYNADIAVLILANQGVTLGNGVKVRVPLNSANGNPVSVPPAGPIRINVPAGSNSVTLTGNVSQQGKVRYVLNAAQGQTMNIKLTAPVNEVALVVSAAANSSTLKAQDAAQTWSGIIPITGDYYIDVISIQTTTNKTFTLEVGLTTPTAAAFERVADINNGPGDSNPAYLSIFNGALYFQATDNRGAELWKYDPVVKAVSFVKDINLGPTGSAPAFLMPYNTALYFSANNNDGAGVELFRFNGSDAGRLGDINGGSGSSNPSYMMAYNNLLYFSANGNDGTGNELWKTDGTNTNEAFDIHKGTGDSNPAYLTVYNKVLYFSATSNDGSGTELWKFDGTNATLAADINKGAGNSNPAFLAVFNNVLYFSANGNDGNGVELWKFDGTTATLVKDINPGPGDSAPTFLTVFNDALYFSANGNDGAGIELWKYDGTKATRVSDINKTGNTNPQYLAVFDNSLFFQANGGDGVGVELWKFKGQ